MRRTVDSCRSESSQGFPPVSRRDARVLVLGSLPGRKSLQAREYYAHPQNAFWRIMAALVGAEGSYELRCRALLSRHIALWDVLAESVRPGSMDADIRLDSAKVNDFKGFFKAHPEVVRICFNGRMAERMFTRFLTGSNAAADRIELLTLPSTSPAYAAMHFEEKLARWRDALRP